MTTANPLRKWIVAIVLAFVYVACTIEIVSPDDLRIFVLFCVVDGDTIPLGQIGNVECANVGTLDSLLQNLP